jgi:hypothetical protein
VLHNAPGNKFCEGIIKVMNTKPINSRTHAIVDYAFSAAQILAPKMIGLDHKAVKSYAEIGTGFLALASITDTPAAIRPAIPMETHQKMDMAFLAGQALMTFAPMVRKNRKTLIFHLAFLTLAVANYVLTDYKGR